MCIFIPVPSEGANFETLNLWNAASTKIFKTSSSRSPSRKWLPNIGTNSKRHCAHPLSVHPFLVVCATSHTSTNRNNTNSAYSSLFGHLSGTVRIKLFALPSFSKCFQVSRVRPSFANSKKVPRGIAFFSAFPLCTFPSMENQNLSALKFLTYARSIAVALIIFSSVLFSPFSFSFSFSSPSPPSTVVVPFFFSAFSSIVVVVFLVPPPSHSSTSPSISSFGMTFFFCNGNATLRMSSHG
mmetsp:Transcript_2926/g.10464  ORF Transcript_2926/g.10464 Transcript_2926/m.10464 type:complete len:240 (-) Transcript_2926:184-903(-)